MLIEIRAHEKYNKGYCISKAKSKSTALQAQYLPQSQLSSCLCCIFARFYVISVNTHTTHCTISVSHFFMFSLYQKAKGLTS